MALEDYSNIRVEVRRRRVALLAGVLLVALVLGVLVYVILTGSAQAT